mmetsp:Transcript_29334/g.70636  ORF Transcript_29334/g.70636 Transcript_29334/m.70636 type:complete len:218 (+) Transcript_29334:397-1050(+)
METFFLANFADLLRGSTNTTGRLGLLVSWYATHLRKPGLHDWGALVQNSSASLLAMLCLCTRSRMSSLDMDTSMRFFSTRTLSSSVISFIRMHPYLSPLANMVFDTLIVTMSCAQFPSPGTYSRRVAASFGDLSTSALSCSSWSASSSKRRLSSISPMTVCASIPINSCLSTMRMGEYLLANASAHAAMPFSPKLLSPPSSSSVEKMVGSVQNFPTL